MKILWMMALLVLTSKAYAQESKIYLVQSIVWQGQELNDLQNNALEQLLQKTENDPKTFFISPSYFHRKNAAENTNYFKSLIRNEDVIGINLTAWKSEVEACDVSFRDSPTFFSSKLRPDSCSEDCGEEVPVSAYPLSDSRKLIACGKKTIEGLGFPVQSFLVHGWLANHELLQMAFHAGFKADYSAVSPQLLHSLLYQYPIYPWLKLYWPNISPLQQPYAIKFEKGYILEIGNFLASMDYLSDQQLIDQFKKAMLLAKDKKTSDPVFHISLRYETIDHHARRYVRLRQVLSDLADKNDVNLVPTAFQWQEQETAPKIQPQRRQRAPTAR
ncbi:hypothetical protein N9D31_01650 [Oligoflexaceae bacterium]|nr:hypothetical protein [Oligoflexaceae bacterium]